LLREQLDHLPCQSMHESGGFFHATEAEYEIAVSRRPSANA